MRMRDLPKVDVLATTAELAPYPPAVRTRAAREAVQIVRDGIKAGQDGIAAEDLVATAVERAESLTEPSLKAAVNFTGVILHTGLGRARLAPSAADHVARVARNHAAVEFDLDSGDRGDRQTHVRELLREITGAEDAHVVNNAASAVLLSLAALCSGRGVLLSRGQMVEIGGAFRMPDVVRQSGCRLIEVGCTNKTRLSDYEEGADPETAAVLRCHPSNFRIVGFTSEPTAAELSGFARGRDLLFLDDQGNGGIVDLRRYGLPYEPTLPESIRDGADLVMASGDKLLGGPQAGLIVGRKDLVAKVRRHPLARAVRIDKLTLAGLEATLRLYTTGSEAEIPVHRYLGRSLDEVQILAETLASAWPGALTQRGTTEVGAGSAPGVGLPTVRVGLPSRSAKKLAQKLRISKPALVGRIENDLVWLDPRTAEPEEVATATAILAHLAKEEA